MQNLGCEQMVTNCVLNTHCVYFNFYPGHVCITKNPDVEVLINREGHRVQQLVLWDINGTSSNMTNKYENLLQS